MKGIEAVRNSQGHLVVKVHYSADPQKDPDTVEGLQWFQKASSKYIGGATSLGWRREMEIDFNAGSGELVFPDFTAKQQLLTCDPFVVGPEFTLFAGFDWGNRNPVAFAIFAVSPDGIIYLIWEFYELGRDTNVYKVAEDIYHCRYTNRLEWIKADPAMWKEDQQRESGVDKTSIAKMLQTEVREEYRFQNLSPAGGRSDIAAVERFKILMFGSEIPRFQIFKTCPHAIDEFKNLKYPERTERTNETEKILDKNNHIWDASKYFLLSHPIANEIEVGPRPGTYGYLNQINKQAAIAANLSGRSLQEEFNDIYGL